MNKTSFYLRYRDSIAKRDAAIRKLVASGMSKAAAGKKHGISRERVRQIVGK